MVGCDNLDACRMCARDDLFDDLVAGECLDVDQVYKSCLCSLDVELCISLGLNGFLSAFLGSTECKQDRDISQCGAQILQNILDLCKIKDAFEPVDTPFDQIQTDILKGSCSGQNLILGHSDDRNDDLGCAFTDLHAADFDHVCHNILLLK